MTTSATTQARTEARNARYEAARARLTYEGMKDNGYYPSYMLRDALSDLKTADAHAEELEAAAAKLEEAARTEGHAKVLAYLCDASDAIIGDRFPLFASTTDALFATFPGFDESDLYSLQDGGCIRIAGTAQGREVFLTLAGVKQDRARHIAQVEAA